MNLSYYTKINIKLFTLLIIIVMALLCVHSVSGFNITECGKSDTYICWQWDNTTLPQTVYVDGTEVINNSITRGIYIIHDINPDEKHIITVKMIDETVTLESKTNIGGLWFYIALIIIFMLIGIIYIRWFLFFPIFFGAGMVIYTIDNAYEPNITILFGLLTAFNCLLIGMNLKGGNK